MTTLRTTRFITSRLHRIVGVWLGILALGVFGCGQVSPSPNDGVSSASAPTVGTNDPAWLTSRGNLPAPDLEQLAYDNRDRKVRFYELPGNDVWMIRLPDAVFPQPAGDVFQLPEGVDTENTLVYYARPGVNRSAAVTIAEIEAIRRPHTSNAVALWP